MTKSFFAGAACLMLAATAASAQDAAMKTCGETWQAAKASGTTGGATWPQFLAECRAGLPPVPATPEAQPIAKPIAKPADQPAAEPPAAGAKVVGNIVFPPAVASKFADLRPSQARQKTCSEQYQANKANGGNGGLGWREKGGGYWSQCNKKLKGA